jgi:hypothetical protein
MEGPISTLVDAECGPAVQFDMAHLRRVLSANDFEYFSSPQIPDRDCMGATFCINCSYHCGVGLVEKIVSLIDVHGRSPGLA